MAKKRKLQRRLNLNTGKNLRNISITPVHTDVNLINVNISDKLQELAEAIAQSAESRYATEVEILDSMAGAINTELNILLTEKLKPIKSNIADIELHREDVFRMLSRIDNAVLAELNQTQIAEYITERTNLSPWFADMANTRITDTVTDIATKQSEIYAESIDKVLNLVDKLNTSQKNIIEAVRSIKEPKFEGNIFQRLANERSEYRKRKAKKRQKLRAELRTGFGKLKVIAKMAVNPVFAAKKIRGRVSSKFSAIQKEFAETFGRKRLDEDGDKKPREVEEDISVKILRTQIFKTIAELHIATKLVYTDIESSLDKTTASFVSRQNISNTGTNRRKNTVEGQMSSMLASLCGAGLLVGIAFGLYKMWPMLKRVFKLSKNPGLDGVNPTLPNVEGFTPSPGYSDSSGNDASDLEKATDDAMKGAEETLNTDLVKMQNEFSDSALTAATDALADVDENTMTHTAGEVNDESPAPDTKSKPKLPGLMPTPGRMPTSTPAETATHDTGPDKNKSVVSSLTPETVGTSLLGSKDEYTEKTTEDLDRNQEKLENATDETLAEVDADVDESMDKLNTDIKDAHDKLAEVVKTFNDKHNTTDNLSKTATDLQREAVNIYKLINPAADSLLARTTLPGFVDSNPKLKHDSALFNSIASNITKSLDLLDTVTRDWQNQRDRITKLDTDVTNTKSEQWDTADFSLVTKRDLALVNHSIDTLTNVLLPIDNIMTSSSDFNKQADDIKSSLDVINSIPNSVANYTLSQ